MSTIYVLEDDESIRDLTCFTLNSSGFIAVGFKDTKSFFKALDEKLPDVFILDIMLSERESGVSVFKKLTGSRAKGIPVIFLTSKSSDFDKAYGLDLGAEDYITKPFGVLELVARVKAVIRRAKGEIKQEEIVYKDIMIKKESKRVFKHDKEIILTFKEYEMLVFLYENIGLAISRDTILDRLWGIDFFGDPRTVDVHISALRKKLEDDAEQPKYIKTVRGHGYSLSKD